MKTKKEIEKMIKKLHKKANVKYNSKNRKTYTRNNYRYGQELILKWVLEESSIK